MCYSETYRAVFSDIDGTLLTSQKNVSPDTVNAILKLSRKDILFTLSSARSPADIETVIRQYGFSCCIVAFSGALILDEKRKVLFEKGIALKDADSIIRHLEDFCPDIVWNIFTAEKWLVKNRSNSFIKNEENTVKTFSQEGKLCELSPDTSVDKILCMGSPEHILKTEQDLKKAFPHFSIARSSDILLEIMAPEVNKAAAVAYLCMQKKIPLKQTVAFGDNYNDFEMLNTVGQGILMGNAPDELKKQFSHITLDNDHNGIPHALKKLNLI